MAKIGNVRQRVHIGRELMTPWREVLPNEESAVVVALAVPDQPMEAGLHLRIGVEHKVMFCHPLDDLMLRHRRFSGDRSILNDLLGAADKERINAHQLLEEYMDVVRYGPGMIPYRAVLIPPRQAFWVDAKQLEDLGEPFSAEAPPVRVVITMLVARDAS